MELLHLKQSYVMDTLIREIRSEHPELTKSAAKEYLLNALLYNIVIEEIKNQIDFMIEE